MTEDDCIGFAKYQNESAILAIKIKLELKVKGNSLNYVQLFRLHGLYSPWNSPGQNTGVGSLSLLQGIFPTWESNRGLLHCRRILYQLILKEISPRISLEGMMLKLKLQYFGHLMRRVDSLEKTLMLGGIGGRRRRG